MANVNALSKFIWASLLAAIIYFSCFAYAGVSVLSTVIIEGAISSLVLLWLFGMAAKDEISWIKTGLGVPLIFFCSVQALALVPLSPVLIKAISPHTAYLYENFGSSSVRHILFSLSVYPHATLSELLKVIAYIGIFFLALNTCVTKKQFSLTINAVILLGVSISMFGIVRKYTDQGAGDGFGPFANRNNFCGYVNMIIPLALGHLLYCRTGIKKILYGIGLWIMVLALFFTASRAGILICLLTSIFILSVSAFKSRILWQVKFVAVSLVPMFIAVFYYVNFKEILGRFASLFKNGSMLAFGHGYLWLDLLRICRDFPFFGTGLGTFASISPMYKSSPDQLLFTYAHNDYLQLLSETGLFGFGAIAVFFFLYLRGCIKKWLKLHDDYAISLGLGILGSILGMLVYSLLDFNLHIPANALLFFLIMGLFFRIVRYGAGEYGES